MKNTKAILKISIDQIDALFELIPVAISISKIEDGRNIYANKALKKLLQRNKADILGKTLFELNIASSERREEITRDLLMLDGVNDTEFVLKTSHGEIKTVHISVEFIELNNQKCFLSTIVDITEQKKLEAELRKSNEKLSSVFDISPIAIGIIDAESRKHEYVNTAYEKLFLYSRAEIIGKTGVELNIITPTQRDHNIANVNAANGSIQNIQTKARNKFGEIKDVIFSVEKIEWNNKKCFISTSNDITELIKSKTEITQQKTTEKELIDAKKIADLTALKLAVQTKMVKNLLMNAPAFIATLTGPTHVYDVVNKLYQKLFGKRQLKGLAILDALPELVGQGFDVLLDNVYNTGEVYVGVDIPIYLARDVNLEPELLYFNFSYQPMYDENNTIFSILVFGYEVTEQVISKNRNIESQKIRAAELEQKVQQRTLELVETNEMLQKSHQELALNKYNKLFLTEFSDRFADYKLQNEFFNSLVQFISDTTQIDYVFVGKLVHAKNGEAIIETIAISNFGKLIENITFPLANNPCEQVLRGKIYSFPENCTANFPQCETNIRLNIEGYIGYPLYDNVGNAIGLISVMHQKKIKDPETVGSILKIVAKRAELELERIRNEQILEQNNELLEQKNRDLDRINKTLEQKNLETQNFSTLLKTKNAQLVEAQQLGQIGSWEWTDLNNKISLSEEFCKLFGLKKKKLNVHYKKFISLIHPEDIQNVKNVVDKAVKERQSFSFSHRVIHPDGTEHIIYVTGKTITNRNGRVIRIAGIGQDVTEKKLASQYAYSNSLIEASLDPLITINTEGKIMDMNVAFENATGKSREELTDSDFFIYFTEPQKARQVYKEVFEKGFVTNYPLTIKDHKLTDVLFNGSIYKDEKGDILGAVVVARDITEQKRVATELFEAKIFAELATAIAEEAKLKAENATQIAEVAVKSKQQFLSNMSHEIRTPMNAIIGFTKVILKTELDPKQKEYLTAIKMSGDALIVLINDILDLAKVDAGKMTFEEVPFKLEASITMMLHLFEIKVLEKNLELINNFDSRIPKVLLGDSVRLNQIVLNLVSNAVKFTNQGKIIFSVNLIQQTEEQVTLEFSVVDTGIGIAKNKIENIFENFHQASTGTSRLYGGTGLGLAIVKQLVDGQGGHLEVFSEIDKGSTFSFTLNFKKTNASAELIPEIIEPDNANKDIKVLVVEDMALNQLLMKTLLDDYGFERDMAANGKIAIEKLETKSYDIILMDLQMPEMNGFEATDYIRNTLQSQIPIIALTADVTTVDVARCKAVGMNDYIAKPIDERLLYSKIINLVKKPVVVETLHATPLQKQKIKYTDLAYLLQRTKSNPKLMSEMISLYLEQTPPLVSAMKESFLKQDWALLQSSVHKMIPSFAIMGMSSDFEMMAKKIQEYASQQTASEGIHEIVTELEDICLQACEELKEALNSYRE